MKQKLILFILFSFLILNGCKKNDENYYIQNSFKDWVVFKKGSNWIYVNENSNKTDSSWIDNDPENYFYPQDKGAKHYEIIAYNLINVGSFDISAGIDNSYLLIQGIIGSGDYCLTYSATANISNKITTTCRVIDRYDTLNINNHRFFGVIHTRDSISSSIKDYYFAKRIGLIKFSLKTELEDSTWSLVRWHVIQ